MSNIEIIDNHKTNLRFKKKKRVKMTNWKNERKNWFMSEVEAKKKAEIGSDFQIQMSNAKRRSAYRKFHVSFSMRG